MTTTTTAKITGRRTGRHMTRRRGEEVGETLMEVEIVTCAQRGYKNKPIFDAGQLVWVQWGSAPDDQPREGDLVVTITESPDTHHCPVWGVVH